MCLSSDDMRLVTVIVCLTPHSFRGFRPFAVRTGARESAISAAMACEICAIRKKRALFRLEHDTNVASSTSFSPWKPLKTGWFLIAQSACFALVMSTKSHSRDSLLNQTSLCVRERRALYRMRSRAIRLYVLRRAAGKCEGCGAVAPFNTVNGEPYLEPHHIRHLADGGPDDPRWVVGVCPNFHRW